MPLILFYISCLETLWACHKSAATYLVFLCKPMKEEKEQGEIVSEFSSVGNTLEAPKSLWSFPQKFLNHHSDIMPLLGSDTISSQWAWVAWLVSGLGCTQTNWWEGCQGVVHSGLPRQKVLGPDLVIIILLWQYWTWNRIYLSMQDRGIWPY